MGRDPIPTWCFALVVVRRGDRFLLVHERKHGQLWYLPAGRVEVGETFEQAAVRETFEEAGVPVRVVGVIRVEHTVKGGAARLRVVFVAEPIDDRSPKAEPDDESLGAEWVALDELANYPLRGSEVCSLFKYVAGGGQIFPLNVLQREGSPYELND